jgi:hypothetical protein
MTKKQKRKQLLIIGGIVMAMLLLVIALGIWWMRKKSSVQSTSMSVSPTLLPTPSVSPSPSPTPSPSPSPSPKPIGFRLFSGSVFTKKIPATAKYSKEERIGTIRPTTEEYAEPIYRTSDNNLPLVKVVNRYGGRTVEWPIPVAIKTAPGTDRQMAVMHKGKGVMYEFWNAEWQGDGSILAGGMKDFAFSGDGMSHPANQRVTASGFAATAGMVIQEDFSGGGSSFNQSPTFNHALTIFLPHQLIKKDGFVAPAQTGEATADNSGDIPLGVRYALPRELDVESLDVHPFVKSLARALHDYGAYVSDRNNSGQYKGKYISTMKVEKGVLQKVYGKSQTELNKTIQEQMFSIIEKYGLYRVE